MPARRFLLLRARAGGHRHIRPCGRAALTRHDDLIRNNYHDDAIPPQRGLYRWHIPDPIVFRSGLKVTLQQLGSAYLGLFERRDDVATVAYWYQDEPHKAFPALPSATERHPR